MNDTPRTDAALVRVYGTTGTVCAATKKCAYPVFVQAELARQLERELNAAEKRQHQSDLNYDALERVNVKLTAAQRCHESFVYMPKEPSSAMLIKANITSKQYEWLLQAAPHPKEDEI